MGHPSPCPAQVLSADGEGAVAVLERRQSLWRGTQYILSISILCKTILQFSLSQLCQHNFRITGTVSSRISIENNVRIIGRFSQTLEAGLVIW